MTADTSPPDDPFTDLLLACEEALAAGPVDSTIPVIPEVPPGMRVRLERNLDCLRLLHEVLPRGRRPAAESDPSESPATFLGRFKLRRRLGQGAFGVVWLAYDPRLKREVALKLPHAGALADEGLRRRFLREAEAAAGLEHPNIVAVHEAGDEGPVCYLVSAYCPGPNLAQWLKQREQPVPAREAAGLVAALADGLEQAHRRGVVHRDLKPANVLLAEDGAPKITDFGLAKVLSESATATGQTQSGAILGTPAYMAPEQAAGRQRHIGPAADIWALGVILYELLTGRPPFQADPALETLILIQAEDPVAPTRLRPGVPRDLEWVCLKCLRKEPEKRYADAAQLAGELRRFLDGLPLEHTRPVGPGERAARWCRRNPVVALLVTALGVSLLGGLAFTARFAWEAQINAANALTQQHRAEQETEQVKQKEEETRAQKERAEQNLYLAHMQLAQRAWDEGAPDRLRDLLERWRPERTGGLDLRGFEWHYWRRCLHSDLLTIPTGNSNTAVAASPDGRHLISGGGSPGLKVWDAATGQEVRTLPAGRRVSAVACSGDGQRLAGAASGDVDAGGRTRPGFVKVWDDATGHETLTIPLGAGPTAKHLTFSPDRKRLAAAFGGVDDTQHSRVTVWDAETGQELLDLEGDQAAAFSPDGRRLATGDREATVRIREAATGKELLALRGHTRPVEAVAFSPDGARLVSASWDEVRVWDAAKGTEIRTLRGHAQIVIGLAFCPDGRLATASADRTARVWD